jgi:hypothetical protein
MTSFRFHETLLVIKGITKGTPCSLLKVCIEPKNIKMQKKPTIVQLHCVINEGLI